MIARKIKPGILEIIDVKSQDEIESYTLLEISDKDAYLLATSANTISKDGNTVTICYTNGDEVDKMFKAIANKHKEDNTDNFIDVSRKYIIDKDVKIPGTSLLLRDVKEHVIKVAYRKTTNSKEGNINRLFITNDIRDKFFNDVRVSKRHKANPNKWELDTQNNKEYAYWSSFMNREYISIIDNIDNKKELNRGKQHESK